MACCGPSIDRSKNGEDLLKMVRNFDDMDFPMKLKNGFNFKNLTQNQEDGKKILNQIKQIIMKNIIFRLLN